MNSPPTPLGKGEQEKHTSRTTKSVVEIWDFVKTAPLGTLGLIICGILHHNNFSHIPVTAEGCASLTFIILPLHVRLKAMRIIEQLGCTGQNVGWTTKHWCDRQAAMVAAKKLGKLNEYKAIVEKNTDRFFKWLPNF